MSEPYEYRTTGRWTGGGNGVVRAESIQPPIDFSAPPEFQGQAGVWTPEHLLLAAATSCFITTFRAIAEASHFEFLALDVESRGRIGKADGGWHFTEIAIEPTLTIFREGDRQRANRLLEKAKQSCLVARSLALTVIMTPLVRAAAEVLAL